MQPFFTIITPVLNRLELIKQAISSVEQQEFDNYEHIIVDNGSSDGTWEYCQSLENSRIKIRRCEDKGVAFARNMGIRMATGKWIIILDSDNQLLNSNTLTDLVHLTEKFAMANCILTSNIDEEGRNVSFSNAKDAYLSLKKYLYSSGEFTPLVKRIWYQNNLHPQIEGIVNEFSLLVFIKAAIDKRLVLSSYNAQRYTTIGEDRICYSKITNQKAFELSTYYQLLLGEYGELVANTSYKVFITWSIKCLLYGKISTSFSIKQIFNKNISAIVVPFWFLPEQFLRCALETNKKRLMR